MKHTLQLTEDQITLILSALVTVAPTGGGSDAFALYEKIADATDLQEDFALVESLTQVVLEEARDAAEQG